MQKAQMTTMHASFVAVPVSRCSMQALSSPNRVEGRGIAFLMRNRGGTPKKRRESTKNDGKRAGGQKNHRAATGHTVSSNRTRLQVLTC